MRSAVAAFAVLACLASVAIAQEPPREMPRTISTSGTATMYVVPDEADLRLTVQTYDADLVESKKLNDAAAAEVLAFFAETGVAARDVQSGSATAEAVHAGRIEAGREVKGKVVGYFVRREYAVKLRDVSKLGAVYDRLLPDTRVTLQGHILSTSQSRKHRDQARTDAARAAREKAELLAGALGMRVGTPRTIGESTNDFPALYQNRMSVADAGPGGGDVTPVGQIAVRAEVSVTFDLLPGDVPLAP